MRVLLVACGDAKLDHPAPAAELYTGSLTRAAIRHAIATGHPWYIVSACHGLVDPATVLAPYNVSIADLDREYRPIWGRQVVGKLTDRHPDCDVVEAHLGESYLRALRPWLTATVEEPLRGLGIGRRLQWYAGRRS